MDIGKPTTTTESRALIRMVQYYRYIWTRRSHVLSPLTEYVSGPKSRAILWNYKLEVAFRELNNMVSADNLLNCPDWKFYSLYI